MPDRCRFKSNDPLGSGPDANPQRYIGNDPVNLTDSAGLSPKTKSILELIRKAVKSRASAIGRRAGTDLLKQFGEQYYKLLRKRLVKLRLSRYFQRHHLILQGVWKRHARFLKEMGFSKNAPSNILLLPTEAGKKLMKEALEKSGGSTAGNLVRKYSRRLKRALHSGRNLDDYTEVVETVVKDIKSDFKSGVIKKEEAQAQLRALQDVTREFLIEGKIVLQKSELDDMLKKGITYTTRAGLFFLQASEADAQEQVNDQLNDPAYPDGDALRWIRAYLFTLEEMTPRMEAGRAAAKPFTVQHWTGDTGPAGWAGWAADIFNPFTLPADVIDISQMAGELAIWYKLPDRAQELLSDEQLIDDAANAIE